MENLVAALQGNLKNCLGFGPGDGCLQSHPVKFLELAAKVLVVPSATHCSAPSLTTLEYVSDSLCRFGSTKKRD